ncbi:hypothetical protein DM860_018267 [Cuscuta australis]|uniref:DUF4283 domain-containing protein n=1 Tax=Cuscuta australis TaxID=267555 RepID=A0A328E4T9_9ASTE|nr:hypothetical protein DM860_018267 [Cuscuta australis]
MGPDGSAYGEGPVEDMSLRPITTPHLFHSINLELPHERKARTAQVKEARQVHIVETPGTSTAIDAQVLDCTASPSILGAGPSYACMATPTAHVPPMHVSHSAYTRQGGEKGVSFAPVLNQVKDKPGVPLQKPGAVVPPVVNKVGSQAMPRSFAQAVTGPSNAGAPKSFAQAVNGASTSGISLRANIPRPSAILPNVVVEDKIPTVHRGTPGVVFKKSEMQQLSQLDNFLLVGKFSHGRPEISALRKMFAEQFLLRGSVQISLRDPRHVMLLFTHPRDCDDIFMQGQIQFNVQYPMRLFRWSREFNVKTESSIAPVWVTFPNLRADLFNVSAITHLCKPIGKCLKVDLATSTFSRPNVAKARVEIDLLKPRLEQIWIGFSDEPGEEDVGMFQSVEYERIPKYCTACFKQGHDNYSCHTLTPRQPDQSAVIVVPQPSTTAPTNTQPSRRRRSRSRVRRQREGKGIAIDDAGKGEGSSSSLQAFVPTSSHPSPNVVIPDASLVPSTDNATHPTPVVVEQSASQAVEPSVPPTGVEQGSVIASLPLSTSSSFPIVHVPDSQPPELALAMSNTFDALGEMPGDSHEVCGFNTTASSIPSNLVRREDDECSSQTSDGSTGDHFKDPTDIARDLAASGLSPTREAPTTRVVYAKCKYRDREPLWEYLRETHAALPAGMAWGVEDIAGGPMFIFGAKLKRLAHSLRRWNRDTFGHIFDRLKALEQDVRDIELQLQTDSSDETYIEFKRRSALLKCQYRIEDEFWRQKAHAKWVSDGERNSGYFHAVVKDRRRKLYIHRIQDDHGQWATERSAIASQAITFFQAMFTADPRTRRYHWGSWKTLARPTREGGVGFLDFMTLAKSCSAKLWWNFRTQDTIWTAFMRAKYCSRVHPVSKQRVDDDSHTWKRMLDVRAVIEPGIRWRVLSGTSNFWWDTWSGLGALHR